MGRTRRRVTILVLSLEALGLLLLGFAAWAAGERRLECMRVQETVACTAEVRRAFGLIAVGSRRFSPVDAVRSEPPAVGDSRHWLALVVDDRSTRVLPGEAAEVAEQVARIEAFLADPESEDQLVLRRSLGWIALGLAIFGVGWLLVISLIMREFLGFHTPWWWRLIRRS
ncbi:MAG: hypothetical protein AAGN46_11635 [Acidobacteriota bacterium]